LQTKASLIAALHHRNAAYYDDAKAKNNICTFDCKQGGKWKLSLSKNRPIGVSTVFTDEELNATSVDRKKDVKEQTAARKRKKTKQ